MKSNKHFLLLIIALLILFPAIQATEVKWKGATETSSSEAAKAPKSQKYWDEHNIERPDYAKTDAEIAAERGQLPINYNFGFGVVAIGIVGWLYYRFVHLKGSRLGSTTWAGFFHSHDAERARQARLERFAAKKVE